MRKFFMSETVARIASSAPLALAAATLLALVLSAGAGFIDPGV
jgi:hypothetical protein